MTNTRAAASEIQGHDHFPQPARTENATLSVNKILLHGLVYSLEQFSFKMSANYKQE